MDPRVRARAAVCLAIVGFLMAALAPAGSSAATGSASLTVSPGVYVGGQRVTFEGQVGQAADQPIRLQFHMNRPGDSWTDVAGFTGRTGADGSFRFTHPAPSMFGIKMRVASAGAATPAWTFNARSQDVVLRTVADGVQDGRVRPGAPFSILVDTTPRLYRRPDLPSPAFPGRVLTLQQRVDGGQWQTLATTSTDQAGQGSFELTADEQDAGSTLVYRVRQETWTTGGSNIGWFPSFPHFVEVSGSANGAATAAPAATPASTEATTSSAAQPLPVPRAGAAPTAAQRHGWAPSLWDFAWEYGESLTSLPSRGTDRSGWWLDSSDGSGRAAKHNGGLMLDSQRNHAGVGDFGTTAVTLRDNPMRYGRWEAKMRLKSSETAARDYDAIIELVPHAASEYRCGAQNITVARVPVHGSTLTVGARAVAGAREWTGTRGIDMADGAAVAFAVEVTKRHISWFVNGQVIATVRSEAAVSDLPMTLRLRLAGDGHSEMNKTQFISDWQRGFSLDHGQTVTSGTALQRGTHAGGC